jgi:hypothetical protein
MNFLEEVLEEEKAIVEEEKAIRNQIKTLEERVQILKSITHRTRKYCPSYNYGRCVFKGTCSHQGEKESIFGLGFRCNAERHAVSRLDP